MDSNLPPSSYLAAARYNSKLARELAPANPEAAALLGPKSRDFTNKAMLARPLSKQVSLLQQKVSAKQAEAEKLVQQMRSAQQKLQEINREGAELSDQLDAVRACLAAGLGTSPGASSALVADFSTIRSALNHMANLLPEEMDRSLFTGLAALRDVGAFSSLEASITVPAAPAPEWGDLVRPLPWVLPTAGKAPLLRCRWIADRKSVV